jgi:carboxyl-terminal processing protease
MREPQSEHHPSEPAVPPTRLTSGDEPAEEPDRQEDPPNERWAFRPDRTCVEASVAAYDVSALPKTAAAKQRELPVQVKRVVAPSLLIVLFGAILIHLPLAIAARASVYEWFDPIVDVRRILIDRYVEQPDEEVMQQAMIEAMIATLDDPYTQYVPPSDTAEFNKQLRGTYAGIGAEVNISDGYLQIVTPMADSPALEAGVMAGDIVLEIEGESTFRMPVDEAIDRLTGEVGTPVAIRVRHLDGGEEDLTIIREQIVTRTVRGLRRVGAEWNYCVDGNLGMSYVKVTQFNADTVNELEEALRRLEAKKQLNGLILDLRDDPGGALPTAVALADLFLESGVIVTVRPRVGDETTFTASAPETMTGFPMVILVNGQSASASEIVAGALKENGRAKVLGTRTFGKGSVQEVRDLPYSRGTLKFTTAHYYLPSGRNINRDPGSETWGVDPSPGMVVPVTNEQYLDSFRARRDYEIIREDGDEDALPCVTAAWIRENMLDEQLAGALDVLCGYLRTAAWPRVSDEDAAERAFDRELNAKLTRLNGLYKDLQQTQRRIEELRGLAQEAGREPLLPEGAELAGATIAIRDRDGNLVGEYRLERGDLELALELLSVEKVHAEGGKDGN